MPKKNVVTTAVDSAALQEVIETVVSPIEDKVHTYQVTSLGLENTAKLFAGLIVGDKATEETQTAAFYLLNAISSINEQLSTDVLTLVNSVIKEEYGTSGVKLFVEWANLVNEVVNEVNSKS